MQIKKIGISLLRLCFLILLVSVVGCIARGYMTLDTLNWYHQLPMSSLTPPAWVFGPIWGILFLLMVVSGFMVWGKATPRWFVLQLMLNMLWSFSFFYLRNVGAALAVLLFLIWAVYMTIKSFYRVSKVAGLLQIPNLLWCVFALYLNTYIICSMI